ncbi:hypothetical protein HBI56_221440 [Parastagonospora nodorum]|nr:hypothetical protein HBI09_215220 [Parastagonospora nodorum]KAH4153365.1 hypothetical protein HBH43_225090 [Parastagonospora nodorum]KAH4181666.1 hypothetical protein HBH42_232710 [Parastagonospora nodorum]KAH4285289.1 hypothetical protein HBI02_232920 [Parastagonospora nodorum]KAH4286211.1 hypothetical protein HBI01_240780 [Parastagonospora nodorum]
MSFGMGCARLLRIYSSELHLKHVLEWTPPPPEQPQISGLDLNAGTPLSFGNASLPSTWRQCWNATNVSASITAVTSSPEAVDHAHWIDQLDIAQQSDRRR